MKKLDCMDKVCPIPVIETKKALRENANENEFEVLVDNEVATENLTKMANELKLDSKVEKLDKMKYKVTLVKNENSLNAKEIENFDHNKVTSDNYVVFISSDKMGGGDEEFSKSLLEGFVYALTEQDKLPEVVVCYNKGVTLTTINEKTVEDLKSLNERGVKVLSCGLCLDNYNLKDKLQIGEVTNMFKIAELMRTKHVVKPC
ncbi:MAG: sulfurtransferase-like selenium metabolism protein YedF [Tissierellia bacterium]|nr:sulfurtransferase-like selenium metabolism protein YedF [Tissierellia bacterium]